VLQLLEVADHARIALDDEVIEGLDRERCPVVASNQRQQGALDLEVVTRRLTCR
jgi:hypothetical protein